MKEIIQEMIVVEGKSDTNVLKKYFECDTIETNGSAVEGHVIKKVKLALERRGVIIFTDPDYPGEKIRRTIDSAVPGCKHAFLPKEAAVDYRKNKVGVEHAAKADLMKALAAAKPSCATAAAEAEEISIDDLVACGLIAGAGAKEKRERLGVLLHIGYTNGKQLFKRLQQFRITKAEFLDALRQVEKESKDE
ncbi:ribonuclease M5 [Evansella caseinilytica]|uniref:Ribonuclease M5 n=1 Tax=Evansella caseinilytica TaxID=1503961 RepID=A0A1H3UW00_9BACI|nr:ribonuclease M5 [Evansella caseinilytica]SDZ66508.1 ribonuclease M5 [Evansella caseinilytica]